MKISHYYNQLASFFAGTFFIMLSLKKIFRDIKDEPSAVRLLQDHQIIPLQKACANGHDMTLDFNKQIRWRCYEKSCRLETGVRCGTWLDGSRLSMEDVVHFIFCWSRQLSSISFCKENLGLGHCTVTDYNNYLREACVWRLKQTQSAIGGAGMTVEIDESLFTKRKNDAGRILPQQWIFGGLCRESKECFLVSVPDRSESTLLPLVYQWIRPGTIEDPVKVMSDKWRSYNRIGEDSRYLHLSVNHSKNFVDPETGAHTQGVERMWGSAKKGNKQRRGTHRSLLGTYLAEFVWYSRLQSRDPFEAILHDIAEFWQSIN